MIKCKECGGEITVTGRTTHNYWCEECKEGKNPDEVTNE